MWQGARVSEAGHTSGTLTGCTAAIAVSQGVHAFTEPAIIEKSMGNELVRLGTDSALAMLLHALPPAVRDIPSIPLHRLIGDITFGEPASAIAEGRYQFNHILATDTEKQSLTPSERLQPGERLFWVLRDTLAAERDVKATLMCAHTRLGKYPDFGLIFPSMGRGPHLYGGRDYDLDLLQTQFPGLPSIGVYGNGEIAPLDGSSHLFQYSTVFGLFKVDSL